MKLKNRKSTMLTFYIALLTGFVIINVIILYFFQSQVNSVRTLKQELSVLSGNNTNLTESQASYEKYAQNLEILTAVFPDESSISDFIGALEGIIRSHTSEYRLQFVSLNPLIEGDKLYILMTVVMRLDFNALLGFLDDLEDIPYMTHITSLSAKNTEGFNGLSEMTVNLKVYVKKPFSAK